jgi:hypothetical protein
VAVAISATIWGALILIVLILRANLAINASP